MVKYFALFGSSALVTAALLGYGVFAYGAQLLGTDSIPDGERPGMAKTIAGSCSSAAGTGQYAAETVSQYCGCYANELLNITTLKDFKSIENGITFRFQIKVDRAAATCKAKLKLASR